MFKRVCLLQLLLASIFSGVCLGKRSAIEIVPAKSFGDVAIGSQKADLLALGFVIDEARDQTVFGYLVRGNLHVRLQQDRAVEIWIADVAQWRTSLTFRGKRLPRTLTLPSLISFFASCEATQKGSGGTLTMCQDQGIQLATSFGASEISLSVMKK